MGRHGVLLVSGDGQLGVETRHLETGGATDLPPRPSLLSRTRTRRLPSSKRPQHRQYGVQPVYALRRSGSLALTFGLDAGLSITEDDFVGDSGARKI